MITDSLLLKAVEVADVGVVEGLLNSIAAFRVKDKKFLD